MNLNINKLNVNANLEFSCCHRCPDRLCDSNSISDYSMNISSIELVNTEVDISRLKSIDFSPSWIKKYLKIQFHRDAWLRISDKYYRDNLDRSSISGCDIHGCDIHYTFLCRSCGYEYGWKSKHTYESVVIDVGHIYCNESISYISSICEVDLSAVVDNLDVNEVIELSRKIIREEDNELFLRLESLLKFRAIFSDPSYSIQYHSGPEVFSDSAVIETIRSFGQLGAGIVLGVFINFIWDLLKGRSKKIKDILEVEKIDQVSTEKSDLFKKEFGRARNMSTIMSPKHIEDILSCIPKEKRERIIDDISIAYTLEVRKALLKLYEND